MEAKTDRVLQAGVLAFHQGRICLITSRSGKRWVIPKGRIEAGKTPVQTVLQEAWEEAGLIGVVYGGPIGRYEYSKTGKLHVVAVYIMHVTAIEEKWPERHRRERQWLRAEKAMNLINNAGLRHLLSVTTRRPLAA